MTTYPTLTRQVTTRLTAQFIAHGWSPLDEDEVDSTSKGEPLDLAPIEEAAAEVDALLDDHLSGEHADDQDLGEGLASPIVHRALDHAEITILDDPGFWRYLSLAHFWRFVYWREQKAFDDKPPAKHLLYVMADRTSETVLTRMYLRAAAVRDGDDYSLTSASPQATDFWRSHVTRVTVGSCPDIARPFARLHRDDRLVTDDLRPYARRLNRLSTNLVLPYVSADQGAEIIRELDTREPDE